MTALEAALNRTDRVTQAINAFIFKVDSFESAMKKSADPLGIKRINDLANPAKKALELCSYMDNLGGLIQ